MNLSWPKNLLCSTNLARMMAILCVGLLTGATPACGDADPPAWDPRFDDFAAALQTDLENSGAYGVSVAVMEDGVVTYARAFGSKDADGQVPLTPNTLMQIGSTTKQMTAVALLQKVESGQVALTDSLDSTLPNLEFALDATWDSQITMHHLLSHQGAFVDYIPWTGPADDAELADWSYAGYASQYWLMAPPGSFWNYSNPNFVFAGLVTEELDTRAWPDIMLDDVFAPLGMSRTFLRKTEVEADGDFATSYGVDPDTGNQRHYELSETPDPGWARPAGLAWTTPTQMMDWASFLMHGNTAVLGDGLLAELTSEQVDTHYFVGNIHYGYGLFVERGFLTHDGVWYATPVWEHGGNTLSFSHFFYVLPEQGFAVSICASGYGLDFSRSVSTAISTLAQGLPAPSPAPEYTFDPAALDRHVGSYADPYNVGELIITRVGDDLFLDAPDLTQAGISYAPKLFPISSEIFIMQVAGLTLDLTFLPLTDGGPSHYIRQRAFVATRVGQPAHSSQTRPRPTYENLRRTLLRARPAPTRPADVARSF